MQLLDRNSSQKSTVRAFAGVIGVKRDCVSAKKENQGIQSRKTAPKLWFYVFWKRKMPAQLLQWSLRRCDATPAAAVAAAPTTTTLAALRTAA